MDHFLYRDGCLHAEDVAISQIAAEVGTPFYLYSSATLLRHFKLFDDALAGMDHLICYAMKAASNQAILTLLGAAGAGMDVVSGGEYARARAAGIPGDRIVFSGVGKTRAEMTEVLTGGVRQFNVESEPEVVGIDVHIGSQLTDLAPYGVAYEKVAELTELLRADGHDIRRLDLGGGLGIPYESNNHHPPSPEDYCALIAEKVGHLGCEIEIEPGRFIAGNAGVFVSEVIYVKQGEDREFLIVDGAMNDLIRPAMYDAHHDIVPIKAPAAGTEYQAYDVVGPVCESADTFAKGRALAPLKAGDLIAFRSAGAYGAVMASEYNTRPLVPEVMVKGDQFAVIRPRPSLEDIINRDIIPQWH